MCQQAVQTVVYIIHWFDRMDCLKLPSSIGDTLSIGLFINELKSYLLNQYSDQNCLSPCRIQQLYLLNQYSYQNCLSSCCIQQQYKYLKLCRRLYKCIGCREDARYFRAYRAGSRRTFRHRDYRAPELFFRFVFLQLRCFGLWLASLAVGLRTLVSTGSLSTLFKKLPAILHFLHNSKNKNKLGNGVETARDELFSAESAAPKWPSISFFWKCCISIFFTETYFFYYKLFRK